VNDNNIKSDLHLHTTASDGRLDPDKLVQLAKTKGLDVIAVTDHDTVDGIELALESASKLSICMIPGVEINTDVPGSELHMLGYFVDFTRQDFLDALNSLRGARETRALAMIEKLKNLGMPIEWGALKALSKDSPIGRPHVAQALVEAGYVSSFQDAFDNYIGRNKPAYVEHKKMSPVETIHLIRSVHGIPALAHPDYIAGLESMLPELKSNGLMGIEIYYCHYSEEIKKKLLKLSKKYDLIPTGGTDYHAFGDNKETMIGDTQPPAECVRKLFDLAKATNPELMAKYNISLEF
jgi:3',5'-nucleoside bisphosphate phosphatase